MRRRLYHRITATLLAFVAAALLVTVAASHLLLSRVVATRVTEHLAEHSAGLAGALPPGQTPRPEVQAVLERLAAAEGVQAALWTGSGQRLAFTSAELPPPLPGSGPPQWLPSRAGPVLQTTLPDGRVLLVRPHRVPRPLGFLATVVVLAVILAAASYPAARRITRRLEALEVGVRRLGEGDLASRVQVQGDDELASLAASFNGTAARLQTLIEAQRRVLASASHELRSPLTRARMALELARDDPAGAASRIDEAIAETEELDALVEELLVAGRLEVQAPVVPAEAVDVAELLRAEAARTGAAVHAEAAPVRVEARLLRVLLRNLLENARRHGGDGVQAGAAPGTGGAVRVWVADRGPGVPEEERERIFEPFYRPPRHAEGRDGGVGLGLYLVRRIARSHGGDAVCLPRDGGGAVFEVTLRPVATS